MVSLAILATAIWHEAAKTSLFKRRFALVSIGLGLCMSVLVLDTDIARSVGASWEYNRDPSKRLRGWRTSAQTIEKLRAEYEAKLGQPAFLIANSYGNAAILGFYMKEKRVAGPGHPPIYFPESMNIENQFSFWPRYDELVDLREVARDLVKQTPATPEEGVLFNDLRSKLSALPPAKATGEDADLRWQAFVHALVLAAPKLAIDEYASREEGVSFFVGRDALYITDRPEENPPSSIRGGFEKVEVIACIDQDRRGMQLRQWRVFACSKYRGMSP